MDELGPLFIGPSELDRFWILVSLVGGASIALALVALVRGREARFPNSWGLLLLPLFGYVLGDLHLLEESKRVEFCGSCHETMGPVVEAMRSDEETLSGIHFRRGAVSHSNACYGCHSGYGIWGGVRAKLAGFEHMVHTVTGDFEFPLRHSGPFDIDACLDCHAGAIPFQSVAAHRDGGLQRALLSRTLGCTGACHPSAHPEEALDGAAASESRR